MLSPEENELLTRIGPGTPMGEMLREYWVPACRSAKLVADGAPERVRLFGENFVAFRATDGRVGFLAEGCPHRCASLALARNEGNGLRCIFHGWKFSVDGACVDAPTEPPGRREHFASLVPVRSHPAREAGGLVWVYLGKQKEPPPLYNFEYMTLDAAQVMPRRGIIKVNWLQGLEALLDSAHVGILHSDNLRNPNQFGGSDDALRILNVTSPSFEFVTRPYGFREAAMRRQPDGLWYARVREVALPFFSFIPTVPGGTMIYVAAIPIDDHTTAQWYLPYDPVNPIVPRGPGWGRDSGDPDFFNSDMGDLSNMWHQDRAAMKDGHWTGIVGRGNAYEDFVVQESMGPIVDRSKEFLGQCDAVIVRGRNMLLAAVREHMRTGRLTLSGPEVDFSGIRAFTCAYPDGGDWRKTDPFGPAEGVAA